MINNHALELEPALPAQADIDPEALARSASVPIPPQPGLLLDLRRTAQDAKYNAHTIAKVVSRDVAVSAAVMRCANSAFFGLRAKVSTIHHAISVLGATNVINIVASVCFKSSVHEAGHVPLPRYWDTATAVADATAYLAKRLGGVSSDVGYTAGLFLDCGIALLAQRYPGYKTVLREANAAIEEKFTEVEDRYLNTNHAVIGYLVSRAWGLPEAVREGIRSHHDAEELLRSDRARYTEADHLIALLKLAEHIEAVYSKREGQPEWERIRPLVLEHLRLSEPDYADIRDDLVELLNEGSTAETVLL